MNRPELRKIFRLFFALTCDGRWGFDVSYPQLQMVTDRYSEDEDEVYDG